MTEIEIRRIAALEIARFFLAHLAAEQHKSPNLINQARFDHRTAEEINASIIRELHQDFPELAASAPPPFNLIEEWARRNQFLYKYEEYSFDTYNRVFAERIRSFHNPSEENIKRFRDIAAAVFGTVNYNQQGFSISFFIRVESNMRELLREIVFGIPDFDHEGAWKLIFEQSKDYQEVVNRIFEQRLEDAIARSDRLLNNILPEKIAAELKASDRVEPVLVPSATVLFTDFSGFTRLSEGMAPGALIAQLDECFSVFDSIIERHGLEKIKTIGDAYMCAGGLPEPSRTHVLDTALAALEMRDAIQRLKNEKAARGETYWDVRIGIHTGPLVAGVIAKKKFSYDVWGDTVNTASRMESSGVPGQINISLPVYQVVRPFFQCTYRGRIESKNKGPLDMFFLNGLKPAFSADGSTVSTVSDAEGRMSGAPRTMSRANAAFHEIREKISRGATIQIHKSR